MSSSTSSSVMFDVDDAVVVTGVESPEEDDISDKRGRGGGCFDRSLDHVTNNGQSMSGGA